MGQHSHSLTGAASPYGLGFLLMRAHLHSPPQDSSSLKTPHALSKLQPVGPVDSGLEPVAASTVLAPVHAKPEIAAQTNSNAAEEEPLPP